MTDADQADIAIVLESHIEFIWTSHKTLDLDTGSGKAEFITRPEGAAQHAGDAAGAFGRIRLYKSFTFGYSD
jgi:hypothetical protein